MFELARRLVSYEPVAFSKVVAELDELYSEDEVKQRSHHLADLTGRRCLLLRLNIARRDAIAPRLEDAAHARRFDFGEVDDRERRRAAARRFIVVALLSGDFHVDEVIDPEWGELASLAWESVPDGELGREYGLWPIPADEAWSDRANPSPSVLGKILAAVELLGGPATVATGGLTPDERTSESLSNQPDLAARPKPGGFTAEELREEADAAGVYLSKERFRQIRIAAGLKPSPLGAGGQLRRFSNLEIRKLADVAENGTQDGSCRRIFREGDLIASAWRQLIE